MVVADQQSETNILSMHSSVEDVFDQANFDWALMEIVKDVKDWMFDRYSIQIGPIEGISDITLR